MTIRFPRLAIPIVAGLALLLSSCETAEQKRASTVPPRPAMAPTLAAPQPEPPQQAPSLQEKIVPKPDPVETTVAEAEQAYQQGVASYRAGHLEAARQSFDRAVDILLSGPVEMRTDERLEREFDRIVEGTHTLEMQALKEGDGFTEQQPQEAPIEEANEITFPVDPRIRAQAEEELKQTRSDLPLMMNDQVAGYINYFSSRGRGTLEHALMRAGRYREMISRVLREEGVPQDLMYLAQAESGFHPLAVSRAGARGMWQFMASRGTEYGLRRNWWMDERQDPEKATRAAARHLKDLFNMFGDWYLAMAAYNSGPVTVQNGVKRTGYADFWELYRRGVLPGETKNYVPIIIAVTIMAKNPAQYGLDSLTPDAPMQYDTVDVDYPVDLRLVAECVDSSADALQELNPSLLRRTTPKDGSYELRLPAGSREKFLTNIAAIPVDKRVAWRYHKVEPGETLAAISRRYNTSVAAIADVNSLEPDALATGQRLIIPVTASRPAASGASYARKATRYRVRRGDTVLSVADDFGVPPEMVRRWNRLRGNQLRVGRTLVLHRPVSGAESASDEARSAASKPRNGKHLAKSKSRASTSAKTASRSKAARSKTPAAARKAIHPKGSQELSEKR